MEIPWDLLFIYNTCTEKGLLIIAEEATQSGWAVTMTDAPDINCQW